MNSSDQQFNIKEWILWGILFVVETIILFTGITHEGVWYDEACSVGIIRHSLPEIWNIVKGDVHPPLYFYMLKLFSMLFGQSVFGLRSFSVLGMLALFSLGIGPARRACGKWTGWLFSFLVMVTPIYLAEAQEIRMYSWAIFFVTASLLYGYLAFQGNRKSDWIKFGLAMLAAIYTHYYGLVAMAVFGGLLVLRFIFSPQKRLRSMYWVITIGVIIGYLPWLMSLFSQMKGIGNGSYWIPSLRMDILWQTFVYPFSYKFFFIDPLATVHFWVVTALIAWGILDSIIMKRKDTVIYWAMSVYLLTFLAVIFFSVLFWPILFSRQMLPVSGLLILGAAYGMAKLPNKRIILGIAGIFLIFMVPHVVKINESRFNGPIQEMVGYIKENIEPGDVLIHTGESSWGVLCYYFPDDKQYFCTSPSKAGYAACKTFAPNGTAGMDIGRFLASNHYRNIWLVDEHLDQENPVAKYFRKSVILKTEMFKILDSWYGVRVYKLKL